MTNVRLPTRVEDIDAALLTHMIGQNHPGVVVESAKIVEQVPGASTKVWIEVAYNEVGRALGLATSLVLKGGFEAHSRNMAYMHESEARFYRDVAPRTPMNTPACYFAGVDREAGQSIVLIEDLIPMGVTFCRAHAPLTFPQVARFLDAQARYHAHWWDSPDLADDGELSWILTQLRNLSEGGYRSRLLQPDLWEEKSWSRFMGLPRCAAIPRSLHDPVRLRQALIKLGERHELAPVTLSHGDTHLGNLYIEADGTPGFLDAQMRRSTWAQDVTYHLIAALDIEDRRRWERGLIAHYLDRLAAYGVRPPGFEEAWLAYRCEVVYGLFVWMMNDNAFQTETVNTYVAARFGAAASDHDSLRLLLG
jgi:hypothetical protein